MIQYLSLLLVNNYFYSIYEKKILNQITADGVERVKKILKLNKNKNYMFDNTN